MKIISLKHVLVAPSSLPSLLVTLLGFIVALGESGGRSLVVLAAAVDGVGTGGKFVIATANDDSDNCDCDGNDNGGAMMMKIMVVMEIRMEVMVMADWEDAM